MVTQKSILHNISNISCSGLFSRFSKFVHKTNPERLHKFLEQVFLDSI